MFIRKFYEAVATESGAATQAVEENLSAAAMMAKAGKKSDENSATQPTNILEKKVEEKPAEEAKTAATAEEAKTTEKPTSETPQETKKPAEEPKAESTQPIVAETTKVPTLEEVLKTNQPDTVLKALGFDDEKVAFISKMQDIDPKVVGIIQAYENGNLGDYVKELSVDYLKMEAEDLMRHQLKVDYPKATQKQLEILYKKEVVDAYKLDSDDPDEVEEGKLLLGAKADRYRDSFIANQQKYLMPAKPEPKQNVPDNSAELKAKENVEAYVRDISNDPYTKNIIANNKITLGEGEGAFSFPVDPQALIKNLSDAETWVNNMFDKQKGADGREYSVPKTQHQMLVATVAQYGTKFLDAYATHLKGLGAEEVIKPIDNASTPNKSTPSKADPLPTSAAAAMAKQGVRNNG